MIAEANLETLLRDILATAALPLERSTTFPPAAYTDEAFYAYEVEAIFKKEWMCVAHVSQLEGPGSYVDFELFDEPMVIVRDKAGRIRVLSRVCPHRNMDIGFGRTPQGTVTSLVCPYHKWTFGLDGRLLGCAEMDRAEGFDKADWPLSEYRSEIWEGFVFVNFSGDARPLAVQYADFQRAIAPWRAAQLRIVSALDWECPFNWKVMVENWSESYHHLGAHHRTLHPMMPAQMTWSEPRHRHFMHAHLPYEPALAARLEEATREGRKLPGFRPIAGLSAQQRTEWGLYLGYPCFMFLTAPDRAIWYRLQPISAERCKLLTTILVSQESLADPDFAATLERETKLMRDFHLEDMHINAAVQRGLRSSKAVRGRLGHLEEPVWQIQRYIAERLEASLDE